MCSPWFVNHMVWIQPHAIFHMFLRIAGVMFPITSCTLVFRSSMPQISNLLCEHSFLDINPKKRVKVYNVWITCFNLLILACSHFDIDVSLLFIHSTVIYNWWRLIVDQLTMLQHESLKRKHTFYTFRVVFYWNCISIKYSY